jgi:hypothetical protein
MSDDHAPPLARPIIALGVLVAAALACLGVFAFLPSRLGSPLLAEFPIVLPVVASFVALTLLERLHDRLRR